MGTKATREELIALLKEALEAGQEEVDNTDVERDPLHIACGNCEAAVPLPHSLGCNIKRVLWDEEHAS
jgi:hypothetical protein